MVIFSELEILSEGIISDVDVNNLEIDHSFVGDLIISLISPSGTEVVLISERCGDDADIQLNFNDEAEDELECPLNNNQSVRPEESLGSFVGESMRGTWVLRIEDVAFFDGGALNDWELFVCLDDDLSLEANTSNVELCTDESRSMVFTHGEAFGAFTSQEIMVTGANGQAPDNFITFVQQSNNQLVYTINQELNAEPGNYTGSLMVVDVDGNEAQTNFSIDVIAEPASSDLQFPANNVDDVPINFQFTWSNNIEHDSYRIELSENENFTQSIIDNEVTTNSFNLPINLEGLTTYYWRITSNNICGDAVSEVFSFTTDFVESTSKFASKEIKLFPNPASDAINISLGDSPFGESQINIYASDGRVVQSMRTAGGFEEMNLDLTNFHAGLYFIKILGDEGIYAGKFMVRK